MNLEFTRKHIKEGVSSAISLVRHNEEKQRPGWIANHDACKGHDQEVEALSWDVLVHGREQKDILGKTQCLTSHFFWNRAIQRTVYGVGEDVNGARGADGAEVLFPALGETKDAFHVPIEDVEHGLGRVRIREVQIGPEFIGTGVGGLTDGLEIGTEDGEIIVQKNHVRLLGLEGGREFGECETEGLFLLLCGGVNDPYGDGEGATYVRV